MKIVTDITITGLPKLSLNKFYSGKHWTVRKNIKDEYSRIIASQFKRVFSDSEEYECHYTFYFESRPLDVSNCTAALKIIEDCIFQSDSYKIVKSLTIKSLKDANERVQIKVIKL